MSDDRLLRFGMITDRTAVRIDRELWTDTPNGRLIAALRARSSAMTLSISLSPHRTHAQDFNLASLDVDVLERPFVPSIAHGFFRAPTVKRMIRELERRCDVVLVQMPLAAVTALSNPRKPRVYQVVSDIRLIVRHSSYYRGIKQIAAVGLATFIDNYQRRLIHQPHARIVAHGQAILDHYGTSRGRAVVSSSIFREEIKAVARRRSLDAPFRILYTGFLRHEKGVDLLLAAFEQFLAWFPNAELEIVGATDISDHGVAQELKSAAEHLQCRGKIHLRGHVPFGVDLFQCYADADVCVLPSRSEGTPRVLIEARAFGCPVIGTRVGGIPDSVEHERDGLLVPPNDAVALSQAMLRMATDKPLRDQLIAAGIDRARRTTVDDFADAIISEAYLAMA